MKQHILLSMGMVTDAIPLGGHGKAWLDNGTEIDMPIMHALVNREQAIKIFTNMVNQLFDSVETPNANLSVSDPNGGDGGDSTVDQVSALPQDNRKLRLSDVGE